MSEQIIFGRTMHKVSDRRVYSETCSEGQFGLFVVI